MNSRFLFTWFLIFSFFNISAQLASIDGNYAEAVIRGLSSNEIRINDVNKTVDLSTIKGSPYENEKFQLGKASNLLNDKPTAYYLRYNIYNDIIELKASLNEQDIRGLIKSLNIYVIISNREYHFEIYSDDNKSTKKGYFILLSKGKNSSLYLKKIVTFIDKKPAKDSFHKDIPASFKESEKYYIKKQRVLVPLSTNKKELLNQLSDQGNELKSYIKSEKINLKDEQDLIKLFNYYDSLLK